MHGMTLAIVVIALLAAIGGSANVVVSTGLLTKGLRSEFMNRFENAPVIYKDVCTILESQAAREDYAWLGSVPMMREWGTGRLAQGLRSESYSIKNKKYELTIEVDEDELEDDQTGSIKTRIAELADAAAANPDYLASQLLINGATAGFNSYDGVSFFNDAHVSGASGAQDNKLTSPAVNTAAPTTVEFKNAFIKAVAALLAFKDDQGRPMNQTSSGLVVLCPPATYFTALEALTVPIVNNTGNVINGMCKPVSFPWLTDATKFYPLKTDGAVRPLVFQNREPLKFVALDKDDSEQRFLKGKILYGCKARYAMTYGYWQKAVEMTFV